MRIGYARVSTEDQTIDLQKDALHRTRCREIYEEHATGRNIGRPQLEACLKSLREGDTFVVWRLDRLGRNLADLVRLIAELETRKIHFESLTEKIETRSPAGKLVFHVFAAASGTFEGMRELLQVEVVTPSKRQNIEEVFHAAVGDPQNDHRLEFLRNNALYWVGAHDRWAQR
jgi:hypothetical protein